MKKDKAVDFVIPWVDGSDELLNAKRNSYKIKPTQNIQQAKTSRYRDWEILKYLLRSIEKNANWVNKIFIITDGQVPSFLNFQNKKIVLVDHKDYIPNQYLPTFSANTIELNVCNIKNLSEEFVFFNDDILITKPIKKSFYFKKGFPCYSLIERKSQKDSNSYMSFVTKNDMDIINKHFSRKNLVLKPFHWINYRYGLSGLKNIKNIFSKKIQHFEDDHMPCPFNISTLKELWSKEYAALDNTCKNKFRTVNDLNQYVFRYYDLARGKFYPKKRGTGKYILLDSSTIDKACQEIEDPTTHILCLNDSDFISDDEFLDLKKRLLDALEKKFSKKSQFEL